MALEYSYADHPLKYGNYAKAPEGHFFGCSIGNRPLIPPEAQKCDVPQNPVYWVLSRLNRWVCRVLYGVKASSESPLSLDGPALIPGDHTSMGDPLVLVASAEQPIRFLMAQEIYARPHVQWVFQAFRCIPIRRGTRAVKAVRSMLKRLSAKEVTGLFPEGGIDRHRLEEGHPGIGYLALKSGVPVIPVSIVWEKPRPLFMFKTLFVPCQARIRYGTVIRFP